MQSPTLVDGKQLAAVLRIKPLRRLHCCALAVFCWGGAGAPAQPKFLPPSCRPPLLLSCEKLDWHAVAYSRRWETARRRVAHQALAASALLRVSGFLLGRSGSTGAARISTPVLSAPASPELREAGLARSRLLSSMGNSSPPCCASSPCGVCIVAR